VVRIGGLVWFDWRIEPYCPSHAYVTCSRCMVSNMFDMIGMMFDLSRGALRLQLSANATWTTKLWGRRQADSSEIFADFPDACFACCASACVVCRCVLVCVCV
jgi:hypothetical protein